MGDAPLVPAALFRSSSPRRPEGDAAIALLAARPADPSGYGRVVRDADGSLQAIVEERDADAATLGLGEVNVGAYCFDAGWLRANIGTVPASPPASTT